MPKKETEVQLEKTDGLDKTDYVNMKKTDRDSIVAFLLGCNMPVREAEKFLTVAKFLQELK